LSFEELNKMPAYKYWLIKRSIDLEVIRQRKLFISDVATAFSDPKKGITQLEKQERQIEQLYDSMRRRDGVSAPPSSAVSWDFPDDAASQLKRWQR
jgi:hypothetical protein